jgi:hypothetical protein
MKLFNLKLLITLRISRYILLSRKLVTFTTSTISKSGLSLFKVGIPLFTKFNTFGDRRRESLVNLGPGRSELLASEIGELRASLDIVEVKVVLMAF